MTPGQELFLFPSVWEIIKPAVPGALPVVTPGPPREARGSSPGKMAENGKGRVWGRSVYKRLMSSLGPRISRVARTLGISPEDSLQASGAFQVNFAIGPWNMEGREGWETKSHHSGPAGGRFNKQRKLTYKACLGRQQNKGVSAPAAKA